MRRNAALVLCGLLLIQLVPLPVKALDYDPRRIGSKYTQATLPDTQDDVPWIDKIDDPMTPPTSISTESVSSDSPQTLECQLWTAFQLWIGFIFSPHHANRIEARAHVAAQRHTTTDNGR